MDNNEDRYKIHKSEELDAANQYQMWVSDQVVIPSTSRKYLDDMRKVHSGIKRGSVSTVFSLKPEMRLAADFNNMTMHADRNWPGRIENLEHEVSYRS